MAEMIMRNIGEVKGELLNDRILKSYDSVTPSNGSIPVVLLDLDQLLGTITE